MARRNSTTVASGMLGIICLFGMGACASEQGAVQPSSGGTVAPAAAAKVGGGASEAVADSLTACLARIPKDSGAGVRMVAEQSCRDNDAARQGIAGTATAKSGDRASAGTQGDSLEACMARIPKDASAGQRMLAEDSCKRDQLTHR